MPRFLRVSLLFLVLFLAVPAGAQAATVTLSGTTLTFTAGAGETNTAVIAKQQTPDTYFVGDQNPAVTVTPTSDPQTTLACQAPPEGSGLPKGFLCLVPNATSLVENLADGNDTGVISAGSSPPAGTINGGDGNDTLVGGTEKETFNGGAGTDTVAYVSINAAGINRTVGVSATLPNAGAAPTTTNGQTGENDSIASDVENLVGTNNSDTLTGNSGPNTIAGTTPPGTPAVDTPTFTGVDTINGLGDNDTLVAVGGGTLNGGAGADTLVGGLSTASAPVTLNGDADDDTLVSGLANDDINGGSGANTLAYASVKQGGLTIIDRGTAGVTATLPDTGTATGGKTGGREQDTIHDDIQTLLGSNGDDVLAGSSRADTIVGAAPIGTPGGVVSSPAGKDVIDGNGGADTLVAGDSGTLTGGLGNDSLVGGRSTAAGDKTTIHGNDGNDTIVSGLGNDDVNGNAGANTLAYASVQQGAFTIVDRGTSGVTATLPEVGLTAAGGKTGGPEQDTIHGDIQTLVGGNGNDVLTGSSRSDTLVGVAPAGTAGVKPGPAGNDKLVGGAGVDILFGAEGDDTLDGGAGADVFIPGAGNDKILSRDTLAESFSCGAGADTVTADPADKPAADCETVDTGVGPPVTPPADKTPPLLGLSPATLVLRSGPRTALYVRCRNETKGCHGTVVLRTAARVRAAGSRSRRFYTLARVSFNIHDSRSHRLSVRLARVTPKLVGRHHNLALRATVAARDTSGNRAQKAFRLRLHRP